MKATAASAARGAGGHYREKQVLVRVIWTVLIGAFALTMIVPFLWICLLYTSPSPRDCS